MHPWDSEWLVSGTDVRGLIAEQFPEIACDVVELAGEGWDTWVYQVDGWMFRFPRRSVVCPLIEREMIILPQLAAYLPNPIPYPKWRGAPTKSFPHPFFGYAPVRGVSAAQGSYDAHRLARDLAIFLRALHRIGPTEGAAMGAGRPELRRLDLPQLLTRWGNWIDKAHQVGLSLDDVLLRAEAHRLEGTTLPLWDTALVHGDLNFKNLLIHDYALAGVIDWSDIHVGLPAEDWLMVHGLPDDAQREFLRHYGLASTRHWEASRFLALYVNLIVLVSARQTGQRFDEEEARRQMTTILTGPRTLDELGV